MHEPGERLLEGDHAKGRQAMSIDEQLDDLRDIEELLEAALTFKMPSGCADLLRSARHRVADMSKKLGGAR
jgi:hypothetical protein